MKSVNNYPKALRIICCCLALFLSSAAEAQMKEQSTMAKGIHFTDGQWKDISTKAKKSGKYIFVDAYTSWCGPCKLLKSKTFMEDGAAAYFNDHFINYTIDMEKGEGIELAEQWEVTAYPTLLFFSPDGKLLMRQVGFVNGDRLVAFGKQAKTKK
ncbi:thioredoxin family protein [Olivibacter domesticus]|uniref:Thioredoxin n=1 Tax=Olivibacter domesticus TaxID=407022 RepID=A0A1H7H0L2_OLID1|nr:thioredoxin family protein [Olivibacter domesticus]SEK43844.1 Thioredoxin [Olivibacter domesticus]